MLGSMYILISIKLPYTFKIFQWKLSSLSTTPVGHFDHGGTRFFAESTPCCHSHCVASPVTLMMDMQKQVQKILKAAVAPRNPAGIKEGCSLLRLLLHLWSLPPNSAQPQRQPQRQPQPQPQRQLQPQRQTQRQLQPQPQPQPRPQPQQQPQCHCALNRPQPPLSTGGYHALLRLLGCYIASLSFKVRKPCM